MPTPLLFTSFELPFDPARLLGATASSEVVTGLGPMLSSQTITQLHSALNHDRPVSLLHYLAFPAWTLLCHPTDDLSVLRAYLRPIACAITELLMGDQEISDLPYDPVSQERVLERYSENILWDLHLLGSLPPAADLRCGYWSGVRGRAVWCRPRARALTPPWGDLYHEHSTRTTL